MMNDIPDPLKRERPERPTLAIIAPVYNEEDVIPVFLERMYPVLNKTGCDWTICFVNDGSTDGTLRLLLQQAARNHRLKVVNLARNFGKEAALTAGLEAIDVDAVVIIDVDLQDPPGVILEFVEKWREGFDVVTGMRKTRDDDTLIKRSTAGLFYKIFNRVSQTKIPENVGDFRLMDRRVVEAVLQLPERNRFMKGLFAWVGFPTATVQFDRASRAAGSTKFRFRSLWNFALDGLVSFSTMPLKAWTYIGGMLGIAAIGYAIFVIVQTAIFGVDIPGYASLMVVLLTASAAQLLSLGIIGEYIARLTVETKRRPLYVLEGLYDRKRILNGSPETSNQDNDKDSDAAA